MTNPNAAGPQGPGAVLQMLQGAQVTAALSAAIDLGVFAALAGGPLPMEKVAIRIESPARSTRIPSSMRSSSSAWLTKDGTSYSLGPLAAAHLVPTWPAYVGGIANVVASPTMWAGMGHLKGARRSAPGLWFSPTTPRPQATRSGRSSHKAPQACRCRPPRASRGCSGAG